MAAEFYKKVPKDWEANLRYRMAIRRASENDVGVQQAMISACEKDFLFFVNAFGWLYEPRPRRVNGKRLPSVIPFITWEHQDPVLLECRETLGFEDLGVTKSRGEGMSWSAIYLAAHDWLFDPMCSIGLVSRNELAVDNPDDSDSLMWKLDWLLTKLPPWMLPRFKRNTSDHTLKNLDNGSMITGYSATGDVASGGRKKWFAMDELAKFPRGPDAEAMASTQHVTNSRLIISTPKGAEGEYYRVMHEPSSMVKLELSWKSNPSRNRGLYRLTDKGVPVAVDPINNPLLEDYAVSGRHYNYTKPNPLLLELFSRLRRKGFKLEGTIRSPWYDHECDRPGATPMNIAQELDMDFGGSMSRVFGHDFFSKAEKTVRPPLMRGILNFNLETLEPDFESSDDGPFLLWTALDHKRRPPRHSYAVGCDICTGLGGNYTSNSVIEVVDLTTMEQVLEFAINTEPPKDFADIAIALCKWFWDAYLSWEANGPGNAFTHQVKTRAYGNIYYRKALHKTGKVKTKEMGWWTDARSKEMMFGYLGSSVRGEDFSMHSEMLMKECGQYVYAGGKIDHVLNAGAEDSAKGTAHGDRVIAMGVALQAAKDRPIISAGLAKELINGEPPPGTMAARQREYEESLEDDGEIWKDYDTSDLATNGNGFAGRNGRRRNQ
jgi:hypothetical protein